MRFAEKPLVAPSSSAPLSPTSTSTSSSPPSPSHSASSPPSHHPRHHSSSPCLPHIRHRSPPQSPRPASDHRPPGALSPSKHPRDGASQQNPSSWRADIAIFPSPSSQPQSPQLPPQPPPRVPVLQRLLCVDLCRCGPVVRSALLIPVTALIWVLTAVLAQFILGDDNEHKTNSFTVTFVGGTMRTLLLLNYLLLPSWRAQYVSAHRHQPLPNTDTGDTDVDLESVRHHRNNNNTRHLHTTTTITSMPRRFAVLLPRFLTDEDRNTLAAALLLGPTLFACNWAYYSGLARTTVASSSTIGATASLFALVFALRCPTPTRAAACVLGVVGVVMIFYHDLSGDGSANIGRSSVNLWRYSDNGGGMINSRKAMGDMLSLVSAACSGLYSVIIKNTFVTWCCAPTTTKRSTSPSSSSLARSATKHTPTPNPIHHHHGNNPHTDYHDTNNLPASSGSEMKLVAFIGVAMVLSGAGPLWVFGHTPPDMKTVGLLMTNALLGEVIPSTIWIRAAKHMSPVVTAMAGAVMVPMSVVADVVMDKPGKKEMLALTFVGGTVLVVGSFVVLAAADVWEKKEEEEDEGEEESVGEDNDDDGER